MNKCGQWDNWSPWELKDPVILDSSLGSQSEDPLEFSGDDDLVFNAFTFDEKNSIFDEVRSTKKFERTRNCVNGLKKYPACIGSDIEYFECYEDCAYLTEWSPWEFDLDDQNFHRLRNCVNNQTISCTGDLEENLKCDKNCPTWSEFGSWSSWSCEENCVR